MRRLIVALLLPLLLLAACATSPLGRSQLKLFSQDKLSAMGEKSYAQLKDKETIDRSSADNRFVSCVVGALSRVTSGNWDVTVFQSDQVNAFALPGGNIGVYSGILPVANTGDELAAVLGHEMAHVIAGHANERISQQYATQGGLSVVSAFLGGSGGGASGQTIMSLLGAGAQVGILLPFSRAQESEADVLGLEIMARAGFDPRDSIQLWQQMQAQGGKKPPQFLSTHPSNQSRIDTLSSHMNKALQIYRQAPRHPNCGGVS